MYSLHWRKEQQDRRRIVLDGIENYNKENDTQAKFGESKKKKKKHADLHKPLLSCNYKRLTIKGMSTKNTLNTKLNV